MDLPRTVKLLMATPIKQATCINLITVLVATSIKQAACNNLINKQACIQFPKRQMCWNAPVLSRKVSVTSIAVTSYLNKEINEVQQSELTDYQWHKEKEKTNEGASATTFG